MQKGWFVLTTIHIITCIIKQKHRQTLGMKDPQLADLQGCAAAYFLISMVG